LARKCPRCGTKIGKLASSCWKCKSPLGESGAVSIKTSYQGKERSGKKIVIILVIFFTVLLISLAYLVYIYRPLDDHDVGDIGVFGVDYWFEENEEGEEIIKTLDGWTFEVNIRQEYNLEGVILSYKYYYKNSFPERPINTFSPIDIWVGVGDVCENVNKYDYEITYFRDREIRWYIYNDYEYFRTHTGLNHLIPYNSEVYSKMLNLEDKDKFSLNGYIVEPYGTNGDLWYNWPSDNQIGNYDCEVILVNELYVQ